MRRTAVAVALCALAVLPPGRGADAEACPATAVPFSTMPGASLTPTDHVSKDDPPVKYRMWRGTVPTFDGLPLSVDVTVPCGTTGPVPLVVMNHGWTDDKTIWEETGRSDTVSSEFRRGSNHHWNNIHFASRGYAVLTYTMRGWHDSCGPDTPGAVKPLLPAPQCLPFRYWIHTDDMRWEIRDTQWLTGGLVSSGVADPGRLAITGGSYGGGQTIMNAVLRDRIMCGGSPQAVAPDPCEGRGDGELVAWTTHDTKLPLRWTAAVPMYTWADSIQALLPNGRGSDGEDLPDGDHADPVGVPIESFLVGLYAAGQPLGNGFYAPPGTDPDHDVTLQTLRSLAGNPFRREDPLVANGIRQFQRFKSPLFVPPDGIVPIFWVQGFTDPLFTALEPLQMANALRAYDPYYPITLFFGDLGHDYAAERIDEWDLAHERMNAFLDAYLRPELDRAVPDPGVSAAVTRCLDPGAPMQVVTEPDWASLHPRRIVLETSEVRVTTSAGPTPAGLATDPVTTAAVPGPQSYKGCRIMRPASDDPGTASWTFTADEDVVLLGGPVVDLTYATTSPDTQLSVRIWDVAPDGSAQGLVTRGVYRSLDGPGTGLRARFQVAPNGYRFPAGHGIKLEVTANDAPYRQPNNLPAVVTVTGAGLTLPAR